MSKLNLDRDKIQDCRELAKKISGRVYQGVQKLTTVSIERASLRLLGVEDAYEGQPVVNSILDSLPEEQRGKGVCYWFGRGLATQRTSPISLALRIAGGKIKLNELPEASPEEIQRAIEPLLRKGMDRLQFAAKRKREMEHRWPSRSRPLKFVTIGTGDVDQDVEQAVTAARAGADCIGISRSAGQSLMEHIPSGETREGNEGTYVTQANIRKLRRALDEAAKENERYVRLVGNSSGLCMPEIAVMGSFENIDYLLNDALYGILFRDINASRAFVDQQFARLILAHSGVIINTAEDHYLAHAESYRVFPQALASHFLNEQFSFLSRLQEWQMGFSHAYEIDPELEDGFLYEVAQAQMVRECFPKAPIKYMPPTRHKTGDIFNSHLMDGLFSMVGAMTHQDIQQLGSATEAIHHPLMMDRYWSLKEANYVLQNTRSLGDEIQWSLNGKVVRRARSVLEGAFRLLQKIDKAGGLYQSIGKGYLANVSRDPKAGLGVHGIIEKADDYYNPVWQALLEQAATDVHIAPASHRRYSSYRGGGDRASSSERGSRSARPSRQERGGRSARPPRQERGGRSARPSRQEQGDRSGRGGRTDRSGPSDRDSRAERPSRPGGRGGPRRETQGEEARGRRGSRGRGGRRRDESRSKETAPAVEEQREATQQPESTGKEMSVTENREIAVIAAASKPLVDKAEFIENEAEKSAQSKRPPDVNQDKESLPDQGEKED